MIPNNCTPLSPDVPADASVPAEPIADSPSVAALLSRSRVHYAQKTRYANQLRGTTHAPNYAAAEAEAAEALRLRLQAHALDPEHTDPAWAADQAANKNQSHEAVVAFLRRYADIP